MGGRCTWECEDGIKTSLIEGKDKTFKHSFRSNK